MLKKDGCAEFASIDAACGITVLRLPVERSVGTANEVAGAPSSNVASLEAASDAVVVACAPPICRLLVELFSGLSASKVAGFSGDGEATGPSNTSGTVISGCGDWLYIPSSYVPIRTSRVGTP